MARAVVKENGLAPAGEGVMCIHIYIYTHRRPTRIPSERDGRRRPGGKEDRERKEAGRNRGGSW